MLVVMLTAGSAAANERHFTYTYESATLACGAAELEVWATNRVGREDRYNRFDNRLELEVGITDRLLTAFYLNTAAIVADVEGVTEKEFEFSGVSSEWKGKLSDSYADALGSALYGEISYGPEELEIEAKVILDKQAGDFLFATNMIGEMEIEDIGGENAPELIVAVTLGGMYFFDRSVGLGIEVRNENIFHDAHEFEHSTFLAGPVVAWGGEPAWMSLSFLAQIGAVKLESEEEAAAGAEEEKELSFGPELEDHERVNARLLLGFHL
jgi:hypothetical protein